MGVPCRTFAFSSVRLLDLSLHFTAHQVGDKRSILSYASTFGYAVVPLTPTGLDGPMSVKTPFLDHETTRAVLSRAAKRRCA